MKRLFLLLLVCAHSVALAAPRPLDIDYEVRRQPDARGEAYRISLVFRGDASGRTSIVVPHEWAGAQRAERGIEVLETTTPGARIDDTDDPGRKLVVHRPGERVRIRYRLRQIEPGELTAASPTHYLPVMQPGHFAWIGWTTWIVPADDERQVRIRVRFVDLPDDWQFASGFGLERRAVTFRGRLLRFRESLFVGGDFRLRSRAVRGGRVTIAVRGEWPFRDGELGDRVATIVDGQRDFWNDSSQPDFLVALMPLKTTQGAISAGGTGLAGSFAAWSTPVASLTTLDRLLTHEYFHMWNPLSLGDMPEPEALGYWFSEGFTDYYTHQLRLRWKMLTLEQYAAQYDLVLRSLAEAREPGLPNAEIGARFFSEGRTIGKLPYWRGMLLAARWDAQIRRASAGRSSLDDAMRTLLAQQRAGMVRLDAARIVAVMQAAGVDNAAGDVDRFVDRGQRFVFAGDELTSCIGIATVSEPVFDAGFDVERSMASKTFTGVDPDGPAHAAGVRDGQAMRGIHMQMGDLDQIVRLGFQDPGATTVQQVEYRPLGKPVSRQSVSVRPGLEPAQRARCLEELRAGER